MSSTHDTHDWDRTGPTITAEDDALRREQMAEQLLMLEEDENDRTCRACGGSGGGFGPWRCDECNGRGEERRRLNREDEL